MSHTIDNPSAPVLRPGGPAPAFDGPERSPEERAKAQGPLDARLQRERDPGATVTKAEVDAAEKVLADTFDPGRVADCYWRTLAEDVAIAIAEARATEGYERRLSLVMS